MKKIVCAVFGMGMMFNCFAEPAKKASVEQLMALTGAGNLGTQMMNQMLPAMQKMIPEAPPEFWQSVAAEVNMDEMVNMVVPVYQRHLSEEDIQNMLAFFATPAGKKLISVQPVIMQESMAIGQQWGQQLFMRAKLKYEQSLSADKVEN